MASVFENCLGHLKDELRKDLNLVYKDDPLLFRTTISQGGFPTELLRNEQAFAINLEDFLRICNQLKRYQLLKNFTTLYEENPGLSSLTRAKDALENAQDRPEWIDYTRLRNLLAVGNWREADQETIRVLLKATNLNGSLLSADLKKLPCEDLQTIDQIWTEYSKGHFGFSIQVRIYQEEKEDYYNFCTRVGWRVDQRWRSYNDLIWDLKTAPKGHLPHMLGRVLYPTDGKRTDFHLNSWALEVGDHFYGLMESVGLMESPLIVGLTKRFEECELIPIDAIS